MQWCGWPLCYIQPSTFVRANDFNLRLWCLTSTQDKGQGSLSDTHTWVGPCVFPFQVSEWVSSFLMANQHSQAIAKTWRSTECSSWLVRKLNTVRLCWVMHAVLQRSINVSLDGEQHAMMGLTSMLHTTVDVYVRADDFNLRLLCRTSTQHIGQRSVILTLLYQCSEWVSE